MKHPWLNMNLQKPELLSVIIVQFPQASVECLECQYWQMGGLSPLLLKAARLAKKRIISINQGIKVLCLIIRK